jgi:hypothetical protein
MSQQVAGTATLEQILRAIAQVAKSPAFTEEVDAVAGRMGGDTFAPEPIVSASGATYPLSMSDATYGDPMTWVSGKYGAFARVLTTNQLRPIPPYPLLQLLGAQGNAVVDSSGRAVEIDQGGLAMYWYTVDAVVVTQSDRPEAVTRRAMALSTALERLIRRNQNLGGLVQLIRPEGPASPGGEVESKRVGILSGMMQRYSAAAISSID